MRIVCLGYIVRGPLGGMAWHHLQYVAGLVRLGHEVLFLEESDEYVSCYDPARNVMDIDPTYGLAFLRHAFATLQLQVPWAYYDQHQNRWHGPLGAAAADFARSADVLLNVSGVNPLRPWLTPVPNRILIDTDPVFTQVRNLQDDWSRARAQGHTAYFTFGENFGKPFCTTPDDGLPWKPTRQPVVPDLWPVAALPADACPAAPFTTVMQWDSYKSQTFQGRTFGMKSVSFQPYLDLPRRLEAEASAEAPNAKIRLQLAMPLGPHADMLRAHGWEITDALTVTRDPFIYQRFIQQSLGEFAIAKDGYVATRSGWFSERTCGYLASGRPVIVQDTGLGELFPTGEGVLTFDTPDSARAALHEVCRHPAAHAAAARAWVTRHFHYESVLTQLLRQAGVV